MPKSTSLATSFTQSARMLRICSALLNKAHSGDAQLIDATRLPHIRRTGHDTRIYTSFCVKMRPGSYNVSSGKAGSPGGRTEGAEEPHGSPERARPAAILSNSLMLSDKPTITHKSGNRKLLLFVAKKLAVT